MAIKIEKPRRTTAAGGPPSLIADGSKAAPALAFASDTDTGIYRVAADELGIATGAADALSLKGGGASVLGMLGTAQLKAGATTLGAADYSTNMTLAYPTAAGWQITAIGAQSFGQTFSLGMKTELTTIAAAATTDTAITLPANALIMAVSVRVTVAIPTAATFTVTGTTSGTTFNTVAVSTGANTTDLGTASCPYSNGAAQTVRITPNLVPAANSGRVRVVIWYMVPEAPTS